MGIVSRHLALTCRRFRRAEAGAAVVEFAIMLPLLLVVFGLIAEGGRIFWAFQDAITGVRDTARHIGRIAPSDLCSATPSKAIGDYSALATSELSALSTPSIAVDLDQLSLACIGTVGDYRTAPAPVAVLTARLTITQLPFAQLFQLVGVTPATQIQTTVTDRSRIFGT